MPALYRGSISQHLRLAAGLVLFTFAATHFVNHAIGLFGLDAMQELQGWRKAFTRSTIGSLILASAIVVHMTLGLAKLARRATLRMPIWEWVQISTGLAIPFLLIPHVINTRLAHELFRVNDSYLYELTIAWPAVWPDLTALLLLVWVHGCIGIHYWLRLSRGYNKVAPVLFSLTVAIPVAALAGFISAGREAQWEALDAESFAEVKAKTNWPSDTNFETLSWLSDQVKVVFAIVLATIALVSLVRYLMALAAPKIDVQYISGPRVKVTSGPTLLEISRRFGIPHASVCGGRARCSTCRVRVEEGLEGACPPGPVEAATLKSIKAPPDVRLACQLRPSNSLAVARLLRPDAQRRAVSQSEGEAQGVERTLAVLFLDVRDFTKLSQDKLPYDVVYLLNEFFNAAGAAIQGESGWIDKYLGDGLMAVFGRETNPERASSNALQAARQIDLSLDQVNNHFTTELGQPMQIGMGIHLGPLVLGQIGFHKSASITVIGRTVNTASRLEALTKERGVQLIASMAVAKAARIPIDELNREKVKVRGLDSPLEIFQVKRARDIPIEFDQGATASSYSQRVEV